MISGFIRRPFQNSRQTSQHIFRSGWLAMLWEFSFREQCFRRSGKCTVFCWEKCFGTSLKDPPKNGDILLMENNLHQLRSVVYLIIYKVLYISGGARFVPSPVSRHIPEKLDNSSTGSPGLSFLPGYIFWRETINHVMIAWWKILQITMDC